MKKALLVIDVQNDFCPGGALAVNKGDEVVAVVNERLNSGEYLLKVASLDWHPQNHKSFASNNGAEIGSMGTLGGQPQVMWPDHCIENSKGAEFHPKVKKDLFDAIVKKGMNPEVDSYSAFFDNDKKSSTGLKDILLDKGINTVDVIGLALDYCVKATALDAVSLGFKTRVILKGTRAVNLSVGDDEKAVAELVLAGVTIIYE